MRQEARMTMQQTLIWEPDTELRFDSFFEKLAEASDSVLMLDFDGTLAPFRVDRNAASPDPEAKRLLGRIKNRTRTQLAIVTGRRAEEASRLLGMDNVEVWGCHGWERLHRDGRSEWLPLDVEMAA